MDSRENVIKNCNRERISQKARARIQPFAPLASKCLILPRFRRYSCDTPPNGARIPGCTGVIKMIAVILWVSFVLRGKRHKVPNGHRLILLHWVHILCIMGYRGARQPGVGHGTPCTPGCRAPRGEGPSAWVNRFWLVPETILFFIHLTRDPRGAVFITLPIPTRCDTLPPTIISYRRPCTHKSKQRQRQMRHYQRIPFRIG